MAKKKTITRGKLVSKLDSVFSKFIRQRDCQDDIAECFTCGKNDHWKKMQYVFGLNLDKKYGDGTSHELYMKSQMLSKYTMNDLKEKLEYYQSKIF